MTLNEKLNAMFEPVFAKMGYDIVRIMVSGGAKVFVLNFGNVSADFLPFMASSSFLRGSEK